MVGLSVCLTRASGTGSFGVTLTSQSTCVPPSVAVSVYEPLCAFCWLALTSDQVTLPYPSNSYSMTCSSLKPIAETDIVTWLGRPAASRVSTTHFLCPSDHSG